MKPKCFPIIVLWGLTGLGLASCKTSESEAALRAEAKLTEDDAERIALTAAPTGRVVSSELEKEHGILVWSIDIAKPDTQNIIEVLVDARTGRIVATEIETPAEQAKEAREHQKASGR